VNLADLKIANFIHASYDIAPNVVFVTSNDDADQTVNAGQVVSRDGITPITSVWIGGQYLAVQSFCWDTDVHPVPNGAAAMSVALLSVVVLSVLSAMLAM